MPASGAGVTFHYDTEVASIHSHPDARGYEYVRAGQNGIRAKLGIDATVPFEERGRFARIAFARNPQTPVWRPARNEVDRDYITFAPKLAGGVTSGSKTMFRFPPDCTMM